MARFKIQPDTNSSLCGSCREAHVVEFANGTRATFCNAHHSESRAVLRPVQRCSEYQNKNTPSQWQMEKIAWTLITDKSGLKIGFTPPKKDD